MDSVRRRLSFSSSPSRPTPSAPPLPSPTPSNSSRLSKEEINEILNSPYETGYTYSESAAYRHDAPTEFMHPRLCRRIATPSAPFESDPNLLQHQSKSSDAYSRLYRSTVNYALKEFGPLKPKPRGLLRRFTSLPSDTYSASKSTSRVLFFYFFSLIQYAVIFAANLAISSAGGGWELAKMIAFWLFKWFVLAPILGPFYAIMKHYRKARYAYDFGMWLRHLYYQYYPGALQQQSPPSPSAPPPPEAEVIYNHQEEEKLPSHLNGGGGGGVIPWIAASIQQLLTSPPSPSHKKRLEAFEPIGTRTRSHYAKYTSKRIIPAVGGKQLEMTTGTLTSSTTTKKGRGGVIGWTRWVYGGGIPKTVYVRVKENPSQAKHYAKMFFIWLPLALLALYLLSHAWQMTGQHQHPDEKTARPFPLSTVDHFCHKVTSHGDHLLSSVYHTVASTFSGTYHLIVDGGHALLCYTLKGLGAVVDGVHSLVAQTLRGIGLMGIFVAETIGRIGSSIWTSGQWVKEKVVGTFSSILDLNHSILSWMYNTTSNAFHHLLEINHSLLQWIYSSVKGGSDSTISWMGDSIHSGARRLHRGADWVSGSAMDGLNYVVGSITHVTHHLWDSTLHSLSAIGTYLGRIPIDKRKYPPTQEKEQHTTLLPPSSIKEELKLESLPDDHPIMAKIKNLIDSTLAEERRLMEERLRQKVGEVQQEAESHNERLRDEYEAKISKLIGEERELAAHTTNANGGEDWAKELEKGMDKKLDHLISLMNSKVMEQNSKFSSELEELRRSYSILVEEKHAEPTLNVHHLKRAQELGESAQLEQVRQLIKEYIQRYDADKTGLPDYALESSGGAVASIRCTVPYNERSRTQMLFGIPLWYSSYSPRSVIQRKGHGASAGECWAFEGPHGYLTLKLSQPIKVTAVSYEHLPVQLSPDGHIRTAPKEFLVYSYQDVDDLESRFLLGNFTYDDQGEPLQMFKMQHHDPRMTPVIELETVSNYGAPVTCLYRFRVHGVPQLSDD